MGRISKLRKASFAGLTSLLLFSVGGGLNAASQTTGNRSITTRDVIESARIVGEAGWSRGKYEPVSISPDGRRYVVRTARGDLSSNVVHMDILVGALTSLETAAKPTRIASLKTTGLGDPNSLVGGDLDPLPPNQTQWIGNDKIAFLWSDTAGIRQIVTIGLDDGEVRFVTNGSEHVGMFVATKEGNFLYNRQVGSELRSTSDTLIAHGFALPDGIDMWGLLNLEFTGSRSSRFNRSRWFIGGLTGSTSQISILGSEIERGDIARRNITLSPSGDFALLPTASTGPISHWKKYSEPMLQRFLNAKDYDPYSTLTLNYALIDLGNKQSTPLWDAPRLPFTNEAWSPNSEYVVLAPTFLPGADTGPGLRGDAAAVLNPKTGSFVVLPVDLQNQLVSRVSWLSDSVLRISARARLAAEERQYQFAIRNGQIVDQEPSSWDTTVSAGPANPSIVMRVVEDLNSFPRLVAEDAATGEQRLVLDPNEGLRTQVRLGNVERLEGSLPGIGKWVANVMYPPAPHRGRPRPLLIQGTYGVGTPGDGFSLNGDQTFGTGLGPPLSAAFPGHVLAAHGIIVAQVSVQWANSHEGIIEARANRDAYVAVANVLIDKGFVDRAKVGLAGFSRTGYYVEYALGHSDFPFAAAMVSDNYSTSYMIAALNSWRPVDDEPVGASPLGPGIQKWIEDSAGFSYWKIKTPVMMVGQSGGIRFLALAKWELFSILRRNGVCTEMYFMPDAEKHPSHGPQNPRQILAVQDRVVRWFDHYLNGVGSGADPGEPAPCVSDAK